jgi:hypothetical protein
MKAMDAKRPFGRVAVVLAAMLALALAWSDPAAQASRDTAVEDPVVAYEEVVVPVDPSTADAMLAIGLIEEIGEDERGSPVFAMATGGQITVLVVIGADGGTPWEGGGQSTGNTESPIEVTSPAPRWSFSSCTDNGNGTRTVCYRRTIRCRQWKFCVRGDGTVGTQERYFWVRETHCEVQPGACNGAVPPSPTAPPPLPTIVTIGGAFQLLDPLPPYGRCR